MQQISVDQALKIASGLHIAGRLAEAERLYRQVLSGEPRHPQALFGLGILALGTKHFDAAADLISRAIAIQPDLPMAQNNLGDALVGAGKFDEAIAAYKRAAEFPSGAAAAYCNLGTVYIARKRMEAARDAFTSALKVDPALPQAHFNLGICHGAESNLDEAVAAYSRAIQFKPDFADAYLNLGDVLKYQGLLDESLACLDKAIALAPHRHEYHGGRVQAVHFHHGYDSAAIFREARVWAARHAEPLKRFVKPHHNIADPQRRLRVGYVSCDLRLHPVGRFLLPLLTCHNRTEFEVFCYSDGIANDSTSERLRGQAGHWRSILGKSDEQVTDLVRADGIDILVDLAMHTSHNRLMVFARRAAPVQVSYLGYCSTSGMDAIDYRFTDVYIDPPGIGDEHYSEKTVRLPRSYWCYDPGIETDAVAPTPALANGAITFGCLNHFGKISPATREAWRELLHRVPRSRLLLHAKHGSHRQRFLDELNQAGLDPDRLTFSGSLPMDEYFRQFHQIDVVVDPFPFGGGTTTCDALWMGVPVVTLSGSTSLGRVGVSILSNVGLPHLIARTQDEYIQIAADLAGDLPRLAALRAGLRAQMEQSPLMDGPLLAASIEAKYRKMWQQWCAGRSGFA